MFVVQYGNDKYRYTRLQRQLLPLIVGSAGQGGAKQPTPADANHVRSLMQAGSNYSALPKADYAHKDSFYDHLSTTHLPSTTHLVSCVELG